MNFVEEFETNVNYSMKKPRTFDALDSIEIDRESRKAAGIRTLDAAHRL